MSLRIIVRFPLLKKRKELTVRGGDSVGALKLQVQAELEVDAAVQVRPSSDAGFNILCKCDARADIT